VEKLGSINGTALNKIEALKEGEEAHTTVWVSRATEKAAGHIALSQSKLLDVEGTILLVGLGEGGHVSNVKGVSQA